MPERNIYPFIPLTVAVKKQVNYKLAPLTEGISRVIYQKKLNSAE